MERLLKTLSAEHPSYGFGKLFNLIRLKDYGFNPKRVYRLYSDLRLNLKIKPKKRLAPRAKVTWVQATRINHCWSLDFMSDALTSGRGLRTANVMDNCKREGLGILVSFSRPSRRITRWVAQLALTWGYARCIRVDNGPENRAQPFQNWAKSQGISIQSIQPGKPAQNAYIERFNRRYREAVLDMYLFQSIQEVQKFSNTWLKLFAHWRIGIVGTFA